MANIPFNLAEQHRFELFGFDTYESGGRLEALPSYDATKRTVIILPGTRVNHEMPPDILQRLYTAGYIRQIQSMLAQNNIGEMPNILCAAYSHNDEQLIGDHFADKLNRHERVQPDNPAGADVHDFVDHVLLPYMGIEHGETPDADAVCQKLSRLTLVGHSFGTAFAAESARLLHHKLLQHYSEADAARMVGAIVAVNFGNMARLDLTTPQMQTVTLSTVKDDVAWEVARRTAAEHVKDGYRSDPVPLLHWEYYRATGLDPMLQGDGAARRCGTGKLSSPREVAGGQGRLITFDPPRQLTMNGNVLFNNELAVKQADKVREKMQKRGFPTTGINGFGLINPITIDHDIVMATVRCKENAAIYDRFGAILHAAVQRDLTPGITIGEIAAARGKGGFAATL